eukprot:GHVU01057053.1.p1 GENE.GHVU01057053.1~~GHVU01057053.1.p1  ORF type:complete len:218 (-),score=20.91 GHVU01057053.1:950-1603(-)
MKGPGGVSTAPRGLLCFPRSPPHHAVLSRSSATPAPEGGGGSGSATPSSSGPGSSGDSSGIGLAMQIMQQQQLLPSSRYSSPGPMSNSAAAGGLGGLLLQSDPFRHHSPYHDSRGSYSNSGGHFHHQHRSSRAAADTDCSDGRRYSNGIGATAATLRSPPSSPAFHVFGGRSTATSPLQHFNYSPYHRQSPHQGGGGGRMVKPPGNEISFLGGHAGG